MIRPAHTDAQLQAMAAAADRSNRPTSLVAVGIALAILAAIFALWSAVRFTSSRGRLKSEMAVRAQVGQLLAQMAGKRQQNPDIDALFPSLPFIADQISDTTMQVYGLDPAKPEDKARLTVTVGSKQATKPLTTNALIGKTVVDVNMQGQPLEKVMALLTSVPQNPNLRSTFVSSITLTPITVGWNAVIRFTAYEKTGK